MTSDGGLDWLHCIFADELNLIVYYMKVTPEDSGYNGFTAHQLNENSFTTFSAFFTSSISGTVGASNSYSGYQAFVAGKTQNYSARQQGGIESTFAHTQIVIPVLEDDNSCYQATNNNFSVGNEVADECNAVIV